MKAASTAPATGFRLRLHRSTYTTLGLGYEQPAAWAKLQALDWSAPHLSLSDEDIAWYDWGRHELALEVAASDRFRTAVHRTSTGPMGIPDSHAFVVSLGAENLYGGILLFPISAMGIDFPVIYIDDAPERIVLQLRPTHSAFTRYPALPPDKRKIMDLPGVRDHFSKLHKLVGTTSLPASFPASVPEGSADYGWVLPLTASYRRGEIGFAEYRAKVLLRNLPAHPLGCKYLLVLPPPPPPGVHFDPALMPSDWQGTWGEAAMAYLLGGLDTDEYRLLHRAAHPAER